MMRETLKKRLKKQDEKIIGLEKQFKRLLKDCDKLKNPRCLNCGSWRVIKHGTRKSIDRGDIQRYGCLDCDWKFTQKTKEYRMRHNKEVIDKILKLRRDGKTYSQIAEEIGNVMARQSVMRILHKFQPAKKEIIIKRKQKNKYGEYERSFKIKV